MYCDCDITLRERTIQKGVLNCERAYFEQDDRSVFQAASKNNGLGIIGWPPLIKCWMDPLKIGIIGETKKIVWSIEGNKQEMGELIWNIYMKFFYFVYNIAFFSIICYDLSIRKNSN